MVADVADVPADGVRDAAARARTAGRPGQGRGISPLLPSAVVNHIETVVTETAALAGVERARTKPTATAPGA